MTPSTVVVEPQGPGSWLARLPEGLALPFSTASADGAPRVRDVDFGRWVGFKDPRMVRKLVHSMVRTKKLSRSEIMYALERSDDTGRTAKVGYFTQLQALLIATQSGTPRAWELTRFMVQVFLAVMNAADPRVPAGKLEAAEAKVARLEGRIAEQDLAVASGTIGPSGSKAIRSRLSAITALETGLRSGPEYNRVWSERQRDLSLLAKVQRKWAQVALGQRADVYGALDDLERRARRAAAASGRAMQLALDLH